MTKKQQITALVFLFVFIVALGSGWKWFLYSNSCNHKRISIQHTAGIQEQWLYNYSYFTALNLEYDRLKTIESIINIRESGVKREITMYADRCNWKAHKRQLAFMLSGFEVYLNAKEKIMSGGQDFSWLSRQKEKI